MSLFDQAFFLSAQESWREIACKFQGKQISNHQQKITERLIFKPNHTGTCFVIIVTCKSMAISLKV